MVVGARQSLHFFRQNIWFLGNNRALFKFLYRILHLCSEYNRIIKKQSVKTNYIRKYPSVKTCKSIANQFK